MVEIEVTIEELPTELILLIVNFISDIKTYFNFAVTCKQIVQICFDESVKQQKFLQLAKELKTNSIIFSHQISVLTNNILLKIPNYSFPLNEQYAENIQLCTIMELIEMIDLQIINPSILFYKYSSTYAPVEILWLLWRFLENKLKQVEEGEEKKGIDEGSSLIKFQNSVKNIVKLLIDWIQINPSKEWTRHPFHPSLLIVNKNNNNHNINNDNIIIIGNNDNNEDEGRVKEFDIFTHQLLTNEFLRFYKEFLLKYNPTPSLTEHLINLFEEVTTKTTSIPSPQHNIVDIFTSNILSVGSDWEHEKITISDDPIIIKTFYEEFQYFPNLLDIPTEEIINIITRIEIEIYKDLCAFEFHEHNWDKKKHLSKNLLKILKHLKILSECFVNYLLSFENIEVLAIIYSKIIEMIEFAIYKAEVRNLNFAFFLSKLCLDEYSIYRLRISTHISPIYAEKLKEINLLFDNQRAFANLREKIMEFKNEKINYIPPITIFLTDIVFVYEGSPNYIGVLSSETISLIKWKRMAQILDEIFIPIQSSMKIILNQSSYIEIDENSLTFQFLFKLYQKCATGNYKRDEDRSFDILPRGFNAMEKIISFFPLDDFNRFVNYLQNQNIQKLNEILKIIDIIRLDQNSLYNSIKKLNECGEKIYSFELLSTLFGYSQKYWLEVKDSRKDDQNYLNFFRSSFLFPIQMRILFLFTERMLKTLLDDNPNDLPYLQFFIGMFSDN